MHTQQQQKIPILQNHVVAFSKIYLPLAQINIKWVIMLLVTGQAETLDFSSVQQWEVRSSSETCGATGQGTPFHFAWQMGHRASSQQTQS